MEALNVACSSKQVQQREARDAIVKKTQQRLDAIVDEEDARLKKEQANKKAMMAQLLQMMSVDA